MWDVEGQVVDTVVRTLAKGLRETCGQVEKGAVLLCVLAIALAVGHRLGSSCSRCHSSGNSASKRNGGNLERATMRVRLRRQPVAERDDASTFAYCAQATHNI